MSWSINDIFEFTKFLTRKNQSAGISGNELAMSWNGEQNSYQFDLVGKWQARNNGKEGQNTGLILNETIKTLLAPFTTTTLLSVVDGVATFPDDYIYSLGKRFVVSEVEYLIKDINHGQIWDVNNDVIDPPSITDGMYYVVSYEDYMQFLPTDAVGGCKLDYIKQCTDVVWGFTFDGDGRKVYDESTSTQPQWNNLAIIDITKRTLANYGISFHDRDFQNFGAKNILTGDS